MNTMRGKQTLLRIFIGENEKIHGKTAYKVVLDTLRREKLAGATVLRGIAGFGIKSHFHDTHLLAISEKLPIVIEAVDSEETIRRILPEIEEMVTEGLITLETVEVIRSTPKTE